MYKIEDRNMANIVNINDYCLPNYMKLDRDNKLLYIDPNSTDIIWLIAQNLRQAEHKSGYGKLIWVLCPLYKKYKTGYKFIPRNSVTTIKSYLTKFHPNKISLLEEETLESIKHIWIYANGYFSYYIKQQKKNLERNCTSGVLCKGKNDGSCPYNHYIGTHNTAYLCSKDILTSNDHEIVMKDQTECTNIMCKYDHSINRVDLVNFLKNEYNMIYDTINNSSLTYDSINNSSLTYDSDSTDNSELSEIYDSLVSNPSLTDDTDTDTDTETEIDEEDDCDFGDISIIEFGDNDNDRDKYMKDILLREKEEFIHVNNYINNNRNLNETRLLFK